MTKKILLINNCYGWSEVLSGGEKRIIEIFRNINDKKIYFEFMTTPGGFKALKRQNIKSEFIINFTTPFKKNFSNINVIFSYLISTLSSLLNLNLVKKFDAYYSVSDYFCDVIPPVFFKIIFKKKYIAIIHHLNEKPFRRQGNKILNLLSFFFQRFSFFLIDNFADLIFVYNNSHGKKIKNLFKNKKKIKFVNCGIDYKLISKIKSSKKKYDLSFVGGLRPSKGIYEFLQIVKIFKEKYNKIKCIIIGSGSKEIEKEFKSQIVKLKLSENIVWKRYLKSNKDVYKYLKLSKVFVSTSHEEGWGISICEALACGVPVVANNLKTFNYLGNKIFKEKNTNLEKFTKKIIFLINQRISFKDFKFIKKFSWENISKNEIKIINNLLENKNV